MFYALVPPIAASIVGFILGLTVILAPVGIVIGLAASVYSIMGIVFAIMRYIGKEI